ncbi:MAG TPA: dihydrodipicolinate synthase family protein [Gaiellaceae bacterium]|nr:dihydrodipicolinate synthase family protein [Gaiellaceae bacterium]
MVPSRVTPFDAGGDVDEAGLRSLVDFAVQSGASGVLCGALAGEVAHLSAAEVRYVIDVVLESAGGRVPVIAGAGHRPEDAAGLARFAAQQGAEAILLAAPPGLSSLEAARDVATLASAIDARVVVQEAPGYLGRSLGRDGLQFVLNSCENVRDVKVEGGAAALASLLDASDVDATRFWGGDGGLYALDCLRCGAVGFMPGVELADLLVTCVQAELAGDPNHAEELFASLLSLLAFEMQSLEIYVASAETVLERRSLLERADSRAMPGGLSPLLAGILKRHLRATGVGVS